MPVITNMAKCLFAVFLYLCSGLLALSMFVSLIAFDANPFKDAGNALFFWSVVYGFYMAAGVYSFLMAGNVLWCGFKRTDSAKIGVGGN